MANPNDLLGGFRITSPTADTRDPWQEVMSRLSSVPASKVVEAAAVIEGLAGSWTGSYVQGIGIQDDLRNQVPGVSSPTQMVPYLLGQPGMPEINFAPYAAHTNRLGSKGGSLIGHPISFSVVGPTLACRHVNWQWAVTDNSAIPGTGDTLALDTLEAVSDTLGNLPGAFAKTLADVYNITDLADYPGGLYIYISQTGSGINLAGPTLSGVGGLRDGFVNTTGGRAPLVSLTATSKGELFRVISIDPGLTTLTLDPAKRLASYFTIPATPVVRGITIIKPEATRCIGVPDSGSNPVAPKTYVIVPPARALNADRQYPYNWWCAPAFNEDQVPIVSDGTLYPGGVDSEYRNMPNLPVPKPIAVTSGRIWGEVGDIPAVPIDVGPARMQIFIDETGLPAGVASGKVIQIQEVQVLGGGQLVVHPTGWQADLKTLVGWFEVVDRVSAVGTGSLYIVRRIDEWDPTNGQTYWGPSLAYELDQTAIVAGDGIHFKVSVHNTIATLWSSAYLDWDDLDSARVTNLINPEWAERGMKALATSGVSSTKPDRAAIGTASDGSSYANPGNLLDLGFRVVLYPATIWGGVVAPDFSRPVDSNEVLLDPTADVSEKQWVEVDYSNGIIRLSHAPASGGSLWPSDPLVFVNINNPRHEVIVYASCVPYTMEEGQVGTGIRVSGGLTNTMSGDDCLVDAPNQNDFTDPYGSRLVFSVEPGTTVRSSINGALAGYTITLTGEHAAEIPQAGFVELLQGDETPFGEPAFSDILVRASTWGYVGVAEVGGNTVLYNIYGGARGGTDDYAVAAGTPLTAVIRRELTLPANAYGRTLVDYQHDTTYGRAKRAQTLRFEDAEVTTNLDGSVSVRARNTYVKSQLGLFNDLFSSWVLEGGVVTASVVGADIQVDWTAMTILFQGERISLPAGSLSFAETPTYAQYIYVSAIPVSGLGCHPVLTANSLPLPNPDDILLALVSDDSAGSVGDTPTVVDLRYPLTDVDQRADIYVGNGMGTEAFTPHFDNLADAVAYANEIQNPTSGDPGRRLHIKVVGYTEEDATKLPITIKTDGLVITGSPRMSASDDVAISWDAEDKHLIDLNGHSDLEFNGLSFRCDAVNSYAGIQRCVFVDFAGTGLGSKRVRINNCRSTGKAQGFFFRNILGAVPCEDIWIIGNHVQDLLDFGIYFGTSGYKLPDRIVIRDNRFIQGIVGTTTLTYTAGVSFLSSNYPADPYGEELEVTGNIITGFKYGIYSSPAKKSLVANNTISGTSLSGILLRGWQTSAINQNYLDGVWVTAGSLVTEGLALLPATINAADFACAHVQLTGNYVSLTEEGVTDSKDIVAEGTYINLDSNATRPTGHIWLQETSAFPVPDEPSLISKGDASQYLHVLAAYTKVFGFQGDIDTNPSYIYVENSGVELTDCTAYAVEEESPGIILGGSISGGRFTNLRLLPSGWKVSNCTVTGNVELGYDSIPPYPNPGGGSRFLTNCKVVGSTYLGGGSQVSNCELGSVYCEGGVHLANNVIGSLSDCQGFLANSYVTGGIFTGNYIEVAFGDAAGRFRCSQCRWENNTFNGFANDIAFIPNSTVGAGISINNVFNGNYFTQMATPMHQVIFGANGIPMQDSVISNNHFSYDVSVTASSGLVIQGNIIEGSLLPAAGDPDAVIGTLVVSNRIATALFNAAPVGGVYGATSTWGFNRT